VKWGYVKEITDATPESAVNVSSNESETPKRTRRSKEKNETTVEVSNETAIETTEIETENTEN
jgi:hypothetical protein